MSAVLLVGTGQVGVRAARQLVDTPGLERLWVAARSEDRASAMVGALGDRASVLSGARVGVPALPEGTTAVAVAVPDPEAHRWVRAALEAAVPVATVVDCGFGPLGDEARSRRIPLVTGCGLGPGLTDVLARHAAADLDEVDAVHVARVGAAGPACVEATRDARKEPTGEWRDGGWCPVPSGGPELLWFPEPIEARECRLVHDGVEAGAAAVPAARLVTSRLGVPPTTGRLRRGFGRDPKDCGWGAARVEVTGRRAGATRSVVYGVVDRTAVVSGAVLAVAALGLAGDATVGLAAPTGRHRLGAVTDPVPFLAELARRGITAAAFEGVAPR
ncbi:MAG: hypothetical protein FJW77_13430 [Actinobacteria bacterium]|nr:hypothetical protein [Actinomycetota bacterium]